MLLALNSAAECATLEENGCRQAVVDMSVGDDDITNGEAAAL